jgi:hypothetical protein
MHSNYLIHKIALFVGSLILLLGFKMNPNNPPNAKTGASFDGSCAESGCHANVNMAYNGVTTLTGLPDNIQPNTQYTLTLTANSTGNPVKAGFQMVVVGTTNNLNAGTLANGTGTSIGIKNNRNYIKQSSSKNFVSGAVSWTFTWTSPATVVNNNITFYSIINMCNGTGGIGGDHSITAANTYNFGNMVTPLSVSTILTTPTCSGASNGSAKANVAGGLPPYTYLWSNGQTTETAIDLPASFYFLTVTDQLGAIVSDTFHLDQPTVLDVKAFILNPVSCFGGSNGSSYAVTTGGTPPYIYNWENNGVTDTLTNASGGDIYNVTVTDANNCTDFSGVLIQEPLPISLISNHTNETVSDANNGTATVTASGGTQPYTFLWSNNGNTQTIENLSAGSYQVTVKDANLCMNTISVIVLAAAPTIAISENIRGQITLSPNPVNEFFLINCKDKKIDIGEIFTANGLKIKTLYDFDVIKPISVSELSEGVYFLKLITNEREVRILKFMKM